MHKINEGSMEEINRIKADSFDIWQEKLKGHIVRPKPRYTDKGEKTRKYYNYKSMEKCNVRNNW